MDELMLRLMELSGKGFQCTQLMLLLALEQEGEENPGLIRAMGGLTGGLGFCGKACGVLTGGCALLGLYLCQGEELDIAHERSRELIGEYVKWFEERAGAIDCLEITGLPSPAPRPDVCPFLVRDGFEKAMEILTDNSITG